MQSNQNAELYESSNVITRSCVRDLLKKYQNLFQHAINPNIIDVGCAGGSITSTILKTLFPNSEKITGVDYNKHMIKYANLNNSTSKINFTELDISVEKLPLTFVNNYDIVFSFFCLMWVQDLK